MYSKAFVGYQKVVGLDHLRAQNLQDNLGALDTLVEYNALKDEKETVNISQREISRLDTEIAPSNSKRYKLLKSLA